MPIPGSTFTKEGLGLHRWEKIVEDSYINVLAFMKNSEYRFPTLPYVMQRRLVAGEKHKAWWDYPIFVSLGAIIAEDQDQIAFDPYCSVLEKLMDSPRFDILCQADPLHTGSDFQERFDKLFEAKNRPLANEEDFNRTKKKYSLKQLRSEKYTLASILEQSFWPGLVNDDQHFLRKYAEGVLQQKTFKDIQTAMGLEISYVYLSKPVGYALCSLEQGFSGSTLRLQGIDAQYLRLYSSSVLLVRPPSWWEQVLWG